MKRAEDAAEKKKKRAGGADDRDAAKTNAKTGAGGGTADDGDIYQWAPKTWKPGQPLGTWITMGRAWQLCSSTRGYCKAWNVFGTCPREDSCAWKHERPRALPEGIGKRD